MPFFSLGREPIRDRDRKLVRGTEHSKGGRMRQLFGPVLAILLGTAAAGAVAQDARYLAANCANCHGTNGKAAEGMPTLAGMSADALTSAMKSFKAGTRPASIMHQIAKGYSDEQIATLATYFAQQK